MDEIISKEVMAEVMNTFFSESVKNLDIKSYLAENCSETIDNDVVIKFRNHLSILQIKDKIHVHLFLFLIFYWRWNFVRIKST